jgi:hypothetical protein
MPIALKVAGIFAPAILQVARQQNNICTPDYCGRGSKALCCDIFLNMVDWMYRADYSCKRL